MPNVELSEVDASQSMMFSLRSRWPYAVGAVAGPVFGVAALVMLAAIVGEQAGLVPVAAVGLAVGGAGLAIAWGAVIGHGHGGAATVIGSLAVPLAIMLLYAQADRLDAAVQGTKLLVGAFALSAWGHAMARNLGGFRIAGAFAAALWTTVFLLISGLATNVPASVGMATIKLAFGATGVAGLSLAIAFPRLRRAGGGGAEA